MKKAIAKISTFVCVFLLTVLGTGFIMNQGNLDMTAQMGRATLPTVGILEQGREINLMRGYLEKMDTAGMREGITLLGPQREVNAVIHTYGRKVDAISFEVRSVTAAVWWKIPRLRRARRTDRIFPFLSG